jgi:hypothetical protein
MATFIRYALATVCIATSVGCWALWWRTAFCGDFIAISDKRTPFGILEIELHSGEGFVTFRQDNRIRPATGMWANSRELIRDEIREYQLSKSRGEASRWYSDKTHFPLWYAGLLFALAAVAAMSIGRFTLRSVLICMTVVAALLGILVTF